MEEVDATQTQPTEPDAEGQKKTEKEKAEAAEAKRQAEHKQTAQERISELTAKTQNLEEQGRIRDQDFELLRTQNDALQSAIDNIGDKISKDGRPDPTEDPEAYDNYIMERMQRKQKAVIPPRQTTPPPVNTRQQAMEDAMAASKEDYYDVINTVRPDLERDRVLYNQIWASPNPYQAAYKYGQDKAKRAKQGKEDNTDQGYVEGETIYTDTGTPTLSAAEKEVAARFGISEENYLRSREIIKANKAKEAL